MATMATMAVVRAARTRAARGGQASLLRVAAASSRRALATAVRREGRGQVHQRTAALGCAAAVTLVVGTGLSTTTGHCVAPGDLANVDELFTNRGTNGALGRCLARLKELYTVADESDRAQLCFRLARASYNLISSTDPVEKPLNETKAQKKALAEAALAFAEESLQVAPKDFRSHYWCGIAIQAVGDFEGTKYTISRLNDIRSHFEKAAELNPADGTSQYCLGSWCFSLADLSWVSRKLASTLFATPPTATFEEALEFFLRAEEVEPKFWNKNALMIAKSFEKLGEKSKAAEWARETLSRPALNPEDAEVAKEAKAVLTRNS